MSRIPEFHHSVAFIMISNAERQARWRTKRDAEIETVRAATTKAELALAHAEKAVELAPNNAGYLDTLAEVLFQHGDKAVAAEKRAIELDPKKPYFRKQLRRLEEAILPPSDRPRAMTSESVRRCPIPDNFADILACEKGGITQHDPELVGEPFTEEE